MYQVVGYIGLNDGTVRVSKEQQENVLKSLDSNDMGYTVVYGSGRWGGGNEDSMIVTVIGNKPLDYLKAIKAAGQVINQLCVLVTVQELKYSYVLTCGEEFCADMESAVQELSSL
jgi:hypothetical protein